ncbi:MAG: hypothetical protein ACTSWR_00505 [Candidatus Helarchaeota archaeon]
MNHGLLGLTHGLRISDLPRLLFRSNGHSLSYSIFKRFPSFYNYD